MRLTFCHKIVLLLVALLAAYVFVLPQTQAASLTAVATTSLFISICGDSVVNPGEECDIPTDTGAYSTTIAGRQCNSQCQYGPYCGDTILQTIHGEECDDGNNTDGDFCAADCTVEPTASGGGSSSGGSSGSSGGSDEELGDTQVSIEGLSYPSRTVNILLDGSTISTVSANSRGEFSVTEEVDPGTSSFGFWATDDNNVRSVTFNTTFDVTQGAVTNITGILIPPTISIDDQTVDPGDVITISGQTPPNMVVEVHFNDSEIVETTNSDDNGDWEIEFDTAALGAAEHLVKANYRNEGTLTNESSFSTALQLFVGVDGSPTSSSDLNRDGSVDLIDFSILIFWWQSDGGNSDPSADINGNGNVSIEDFSIMLFNWTG